MAYQNTTAQFRPELQVKVEEAMEIDNNFIADKLFPVFPSKTRSGYYKRIKRGNGQLLANPNPSGADAGDPLVRASGTAYRQTTRTSDQDNYKCVDRGLKEVIDDTDKQEESRFFDLEASTAIWLKRQIRIARESRAAGVVYNPNLWGNFQTLTQSGGNPVWYTYANVQTLDFASDLKAAIRTVKKRQEACNTLVISKDLWDLVTSSAILRSYFFGTAGGNASIDRDLLANKFELKNILVAEAAFDTTPLGQASSDNNLTWVWNDSYFWVGNVVGGAPEMGGAGRTFVLEDLTYGELYVTETYRDEDKRSDILRVREDDVIKVVNENSGILCQVNPVTGGVPTYIG